MARGGAHVPGSPGASAVHTRVSRVARGWTARWATRAGIGRHCAVVRGAPSLAVWWKPGEEEIRIVMSDMPPARTRITIAEWRIRVDATCQDLTSRGWGRKHSGIKEVAHLDRSLLILVLAVWGVAHGGSACREHGHRWHVNCADRRDTGRVRVERVSVRWVLSQAEHQSISLRAAHAGQVCACASPHRRMELFPVWHTTPIVTRDVFPHTCVGERGTCIGHPGLS
jgi:hypothetical protein